MTLATLGAVAGTVSMTGCGGTKFNGTASQLSAASNSTPEVYGYDPYAYAIAVDHGLAVSLDGSLYAASGLISVTSGATGPTAYLTGAEQTPAGLASTLPAGNPLRTAGFNYGFSPGGDFANQHFYGAISPTDVASTFEFAPYIVNGQQNGQAIGINTAAFTLQFLNDSGTGFVGSTVTGLNFTGGISISPTGQDVDLSNQFTLPAAQQTTGVHALAATIVDSAGGTSSTVFAYPVVANTQYGLAEAQLSDANGNIITFGNNGAEATLSSGTLATGLTSFKSLGIQTTAQADDAGNVLFFLVPGTSTITVNYSEPNSSGTLIAQTPYTFTVTVVGGQTDNTMLVGSGMNQTTAPLVAAPTPTPSASPSTGG
jgi:hypothetical protein